MSSLLEACRWLAGTALATALHESDNGFSIVESVHVIGIVAVVGVIAIVDLHVLGVFLRALPTPALVPPLVRIAWLGFAVMAVTGLLLFAAEAADLYFNTAFRVKLLLLAGVGLNQLYFHRFVRDGAAARRSAAVSLTLWGAVVIAGRAIAYV